MKESSCSQCKILQALMKENRLFIDWTQRPQSETQQPLSLSHCPSMLISEEQGMYHE